jgi:putative transposase
MTRKRKASDEVLVGRAPKKKGKLSMILGMDPERFKILTNGIGIPFGSHGPSLDEKLSWTNVRRHHLDCGFTPIKYTPPEVKIESKKKKETSRRIKDASKLYRCFKIRILPTTEQKQVFSRWFGIARVAYNKARDLVCKDKEENNWKTIRNKTVFKKNATEEELKKTPWFYDDSLCPSRIREEAVHSFCSAVNSTRESLKVNNKPHLFNMKHKSKKDKEQSIVIAPTSGKNPSIRLCRNKSGNGFKFYVSTLKSVVPCNNKKQFNKIWKLIEDQSGGKKNKQGHLLHKTQCILKSDRDGSYYLCIPYQIDHPSVEKTSDNQAGKYATVIALDPGVRMFMTGITNSGLIYEYGHSAVNRIFRLGVYMDKLISQIATFQTNKKSKIRRRILKRMNRALDRMRNKIRNLVSDMHKKIVRHLCNQFNVILIPTFEVSQMIKKMNRKIGRKTVRNMVTLRHFEFRQRLLYKAEELGVKVYEITEEYTSKTCGNCGDINYHLGGSKVFSCSSCHWKLDRDWNGARNILIKNIDKCHLHLSPLSHTVWDEVC